MLTIIIVDIQQFTFSCRGVIIFNLSSVQVIVSLPKLPRVNTTLTYFDNYKIFFGNKWVKNK